MSHRPPPIFANAMTMPMLGVGDDFAGATPKVLGGGSLASSALTGSRAYYVPYHLPAGCLVKRMWYVVGATGGTNTIQLGIYDQAGNLIVSTSATTVGTANNLVHLDVTDTYLPPGSYYLAVVINGTTATILRWGLTTTPLGQLQCLQQASAAPLPNPATFAASNDNIIPYIGITTTASP